MTTDQVHCGFAHSRHSSAEQARHGNHRQNLHGKLPCDSFAAPRCSVVRCVCCCRSKSSRFWRSTSSGLVSLFLTRNHSSRLCCCSRFRDFAGGPAADDLRPADIGAQVPFAVLISIGALKLSFCYFFFFFFCVCFATLQRWRVFDAQVQRELHGGRRARDQNLRDQGESQRESCLFLLRFSAVRLLVLQSLKMQWISGVH